MCHKRHTNLKEMLLADCARKVNQGLSKWKKKPDQICNCQGTKVNGKCVFDKQCLIENVIYRVTWLPMLKTYIGKSMGPAKSRINSHITDLAPLWKKRELE